MYEKMPWWSSALIALLALTLLLVSAATQADPPAAAATTPTSPPVAVVPMTCAAPKIPTRVSVAPEDIQYLHEKTHLFVLCVKKYIDDHQAQAVQLGAQQKGEIDAANAAAQNVNDFLAQVKDFSRRNDPNDPDYKRDHGK